MNDLETDLKNLQDNKVENLNGNNANNYTNAIASHEQRLIELEEEGWKFSCDKYDINIDNSLYLGNKNSIKENQNIFISGINNEKEQIIKWEISKL